MSAIVARQVTKAFGKGDTRTSILNGVDFAANGGQMTFITGPSGCGKTTFISVLTAMLTPDGGTVSVFGAEPHRMKKTELTRFRRDMVGFVFQQFNLMPALDAAENAAVPLVIRGMASGKARAKACDWLERLGIGSQAGKLPAQLSGGQQQRVAIARALIHEPQLLVCDEPTASLDAASGKSVMMLLRDLSLQPDRAAIVVTHDDRVYSFADRIVSMADGRVVRSVDQTPISGDSHS